jgi:hypothetical protein
VEFYFKSRNKYVSKISDLSLLSLMKELCVMISTLPSVVFIVVVFCLVVALAVLIAI